MVGKEFLDQSYQNRISLRSLNIKQNLFSFQRRCAQLAVKKEACGLHFAGLECYLQGLCCHRGRRILNQSVSLYPLPLPAPLSLSKPSCWEKNPDHSALPGCCSICGYWIAFCVWQPFLVNWHSTPCAAPNVICYISICSSCRFFWMKSLSVCLLNVSPSPVSIFSLTHGSFPAALKCIQNKWCTKDSLNTAKQL